MTDLAAVVAKDRAEAAIAALREEGVYDDRRQVAERDADTVLLPVTVPPTETPVREVREADLPTRDRGLDSRLRERGWTDAEIESAPASWAVVGSVVLVDVEGVSRPEELGAALLDLHGEADTVLARGGIAGETRDPHVEVLAGEGDTETVHTEHGTQYALDLAETMFSPGNAAERAGMADVVSPDERVFDMFAGIGYFTLPMARAGAAVTAAEVDPEAYRYLVENAVLNDVTERVEAIRADCRDVETTADRVVMGYYPDAGGADDDVAGFLDTAIDALVPGGVVHYHESTPEAELWDRPVERIEAAADRAGRSVAVEDRRRVKSYSAGVAHVVVDARID